MHVRIAVPGESAWYSDLVPQFHAWCTQAQECFYTKAAADRKSPALLARITSQVTAAVVCRPSKCEYEPCGLSCIITVASSRVFRHAF